MFGAPILGMVLLGMGFWVWTPFLNHPNMPFLDGPDTFLFNDGYETMGQTIGGIMMIASASLITLPFHIGRWTSRYSGSRLFANPFDNCST